MIFIVKMVGRGKNALENANEEDARVLELAARLSRQILDGEEVVLP